MHDLSLSSPSPLNLIMDYVSILCALFYSLLVFLYSMDKAFLSPLSTSTPKSTSKEFYRFLTRKLIPKVIQTCTFGAVIGVVGVLSVEYLLTYCLNAAFLAQFVHFSAWIYFDNTASALRNVFCEFGRRLQASLAFKISPEAKKTNKVHFNLVKNTVCLIPALVKATRPIQRNEVPWGSSPKCKAAIEAYVLRHHASILFYM